MNMIYSCVWIQIHRVIYHGFILKWNSRAIKKYVSIFAILLKYEWDLCFLKDKYLYRNKMKPYITSKREESLNGKK